MCGRQMYQDLEKGTIVGVLVRFTESIKHDIDNKEVTWALLTDP